MKRLCLITATALALASSPLYAAAPDQLRVLGNFTGNKKQVDLVERPFFEGLAKEVGVTTHVSYSPMDMINVKAANALRLIKSGAFDVASVQIGMASRDDPFFEGVDLAGVAADIPSLHKVVDAYRDAFDAELQKKFNAKLMTLWPFGPQIFFCKKPIESLDDFKGLKVRTFTPSMSTLVKHLGATPVTLQFSEVYLALQRGVADCGVTGASAGNNGKWPEVTKYLLPLAVSGSVQGHFMNLDTWKKFSPEQQQKLEAAFRGMETRMWDLASDANQDAINCNTGKAECKEHQKYDMKLEAVTPGELANIKEAVSQVVLPEWGKTCNAVAADCGQRWDATVGKAMGYSIQ